MNPTMGIKHGVRLEHFTAQASLAACITATIMAKYGYDFIITSVRDGVHMKGSLHYSGRAFDFRTQKLNEGQRSLVFSDIRSALGPEFDVVLEKDHGHVEWDPDYLKPGKAATEDNG